jgi:hypothetical protein
MTLYFFINSKVWGIGLFPERPKRGDRVMHDDDCLSAGALVRELTDSSAHRKPMKKIGLSVLSPKYEVFCCDQSGPPARRSEPDWRKEGAYLTHSTRCRLLRAFDALPHAARVTCIRRPLFFRVARSTRMTQIWALLRQSDSDRLEKRPSDLRQNTSYFEDRTLASSHGFHRLMKRPRRNNRNFRLCERCSS